MKKSATQIAYEEIASRMARERFYRNPQLEDAGLCTSHTIAGLGWVCAKIRYFQRFSVRPSSCSPPSRFLARFSSLLAALCSSLGAMPLGVARSIGAAVLALFCSRNSLNHK